MSLAHRAKRARVNGRCLIGRTPKGRWARTAYAGVSGQRRQQRDGRGGQWGRAKAHGRLRGRAALSRASSKRRR